MKDLRELDYIVITQKLLNSNLKDKEKIIIGLVRRVSKEGAFTFTNRELGEFLGVSQKTISELISSLVKKGYLLRSVICEDKVIKVRVLILSSKGNKFYEVE